MPVTPPLWRQRITSSRSAWSTVRAHLKNDTKPARSILTVNQVSSLLPIGNMKFCPKFLKVLSVHCNKYGNLPIK